LPGGGTGVGGVALLVGVPAGAAVVTVIGAGTSVDLPVEVAADAVTFVSATLPP